MHDANPAPELMNDAADHGYELPPGDHANEIAARRGFGPLSPLSSEVWHGQAVPCVSCGQLVRRDAAACDECGQDLSDDMLDRMMRHAGPWYVHEHVRPFPGVTRERMIRQILRGVLNETSIVRGPETDHQWRFAVETPGLCRYFGKCWSCHGDVEPDHLFCPACLSDLRFYDPPGRAESAGPGLRRTTGRSPAAPRNPTSAPSPPSAPVGNPRHEPARIGPRPEPGGAPLGAPPRARSDEVRAAQRDPKELEGLRQALKTATVAAGYDPEADAPPRVFGIRVFWLIGALVLGSIALLIAIVQFGS